ncbi:MAG TPA: metallophosphoesterase [Bacteroidetes bacterium]|nr:metallophosphoesterase [Bacteroidota bacterium]
MGHKFVKSFLVIILVSAFLSACEKVDMRGMFLSYESANSRFEQSMEWNSTHPFKELVVPSDEYTIFAMSDSHVGGTQNLDTFFENAVSGNAVAAVMTGDLTTGQADDYEVFEQHLPDPVTIALFPVVGNHDLYFNGWDQFNSRFGSSTYLFTVITPAGKDIFICLDSGGGTLGSKQLDWLKDILKTERSDCRRCIIFTHNNLFRFRRTAATSPLVEELHVLMDLFIRHRVDMVVTGHDHRKASGLIGNTILIILDALLDGYSDAGYMEIRITDGGIDYSFINL